MIERLSRNADHGEIGPGQFSASMLLSAFALCPGLATAEPDSGLVLEEVVVTAEKLDRSLKETATSVTIFDGESLKKKGQIDGIDDVLSQLANVTNTGNGFVPTVRGVDGTGPAEGGTGFFGGTRNRLTMQIDGRPLTFNEAVYGNQTVYDVQQIEVLRGPQSTMQGRNSIAGTLAITTNDPVFDFEAGARFAMGEYNFRQQAAYISGPLFGDEVAGRLTVDHQVRDSWVMMEPYERESDPGRHEMTTVRGKLLVRPAQLETFSTLFTVQHSDFRGPQVEFVKAPYEEHVSHVPVLGPAEPVFRPESTAVIAESSWDLSDTASVKNIFSYTDFFVSRSIIPGAGNLTVDGSEFVVEPQLRLYLLDGRLSWLSGLFYFESSQSDAMDIGGAAFEDRTRNRAAFTEATFQATDRLDLTLGGRFESETRKRFHTGGIFPIDLDVTTDVFMPKLGISYDLSDQVRIGALLSRGYNGGGAGLSLFPVVNDYVYGPEYVWNYEAYFRANVRDTLLLTGNVFYSDYEDLQVNFDTDPPNFTFLVVNLPDVKTYGVDFGIRWLALPGLEFHADIGAMRSDITAPDTVLDGSELSRAPQLTGTLGISHSNELGIEASFDARYSGAYYSRVINVEDERVSSFWVADAQLAYNWSERVRIFASATNVFDTSAPTFIRAGLSELPVATIVRPRTFNAGISLSF